MLAATAAQTLTPQAASISGDGTYSSATVVVRSPLSVASHGPRDEVVPATTHRDSRAQASEEAVLASVALRHTRPKVVVRATSDVVDEFARATQSSFAHVSDVRVHQVEGTVRAAHVIPASWVASRITWWLDVAAATRQLSSLVHDKAVTSSPTVQVRGVGTDQVVAASLVKARREPPVMPVVSTIAHEASAKQSILLTPRPACGAVSTFKDSPRGR